MGPASLLLETSKVKSRTKRPNCYGIAPVSKLNFKFWVWIGECFFMGLVKVWN